MDTRAGADTPEAAAGREGSARSVLEAGRATTVVDAMLPRLFAPITLEQRPERVEPMMAVMEKTSPRGIAGALRGMAIRPDRRALLPGISVPTLVLVGEHDVITPPAEARAMAVAIPGARLEVIPDAGHMAPYENYSAANAVILQFLNSLEGPL
jgi:pimeloyl-ACP methyl ester carboxylesterase